MQFKELLEGSLRETALRGQRSRKDQSALDILLTTQELLTPMDKKPGKEDRRSTQLHNVKLKFGK